MRPEYRTWLSEKGYSPKTIQTQISHITRLEKYYGSLDEAFLSDRLEKLLAELKYSSEDERRGKANPSKIPFSGNIRTSLASYRVSAAWYRDFLDAAPATEIEIDTRRVERNDNSRLLRAEVFGLERDLQMALRHSIIQLDPSLKIIDDGNEKAVETGLIDILAQDKTGANVVIELKVGTTPASAITQLLGYMADIRDEFPDTPVRGILVAADFDKRSIAAASMIPNLQLVRYRFNFIFDPI